MLINDVDTQGRWRARVKDEWIAAQSGPSSWLEPQMLHWRS